MLLCGEGFTAGFKILTDANKHNEKMWNIKKVLGRIFIVWLNLIETISVFYFKSSRVYLIKAINKYVWIMNQLSGLNNKQTEQISNYLPTLLKCTVQLSGVWQQWPLHKVNFLHGALWTTVLPGGRQRWAGHFWSAWGRCSSSATSGCPAAWRRQATAAERKITGFTADLRREMWARWETKRWRDEESTAAWEERVQLDFTHQEQKHANMWSTFIPGGLSWSFPPSVHTGQQVWLHTHFRYIMTHLCSKPPPISPLLVRCLENSVVGSVYWLHICYND